MATSKEYAASIATAAMRLLEVVDKVVDSDHQSEIHRQLAQIDDEITSLAEWAEEESPL